MNQFETAIRNEAAKLIRRFETYAGDLADEQARRERRTTGATPGLTLLRPDYWGLAQGFNPYLTRARASRIGHAVRERVRERTYAPRSPAAYEVPRADGTARQVAVFQVADNAVSALIFRNLVEKNRPRMSARSYAYRDDLTVHDALQHLQAEFGVRERLFVAEYDFSRYFDNIDHDHIFRALYDERFLLTDVEDHVIRAFLAAPLPRQAPDYGEFQGDTRTRGVPQGTSISLFLANVAAAPLDKALERLGVGFVRYADDTVIWSRDYAQICRAVDELYEASKRMGAELNPEKSAGVRLLVGPAMTAELPSTDHLDFVGYQVRLHDLQMRDSAVRRVKERLQRLLYFNLLDAPLRGTQDADRLKGRVDKDYVVFIWQARRYLYGDLSEVELRRYQRQGIPLRRFKGLMSFYPLLDDTEQLRQLDSWLGAQVWLAMRRRRTLLEAAGFPPLPPPLGLSLSELLRYRRKSATTGGTLDLRVPSFRRIASVVRQAAKQYGPNAVGRGRNPYAY